MLDLAQSLDGLFGRIAALGYIRLATYLPNQFVVERGDRLSL